MVYEIPLLLPLPRYAVLVVRLYKKVVMEVSVIAILANCLWRVDICHTFPQYLFDAREAYN